MNQQQVLTHFFDNVVPAFEYYVELSKQKGNKKALLMNAALDVAGKLFHFRDKLEPMFAPKTLRRTDVAKLCPDFDWLGDVFNAAKHTDITRPDRIIKDISQVEETIVWTYFPFEGEEIYPRKFYSTVQTRILVNPLPGKGSIRDLLEVCTSVLNFWAQFLKDHGFSHSFSSFRYEGDDIIPESQQDKSSGSFYAGYDGVAKVVMIARYYEPKEGKFKRWGYTDDGRMNSVEIDERAPNAKVYGRFGDKS